MDWLLSPKAVEKMQELMSDPCFDGSEEVMAEFLRRMEQDKQALRLELLSDERIHAYRTVGWRSVHCVELDPELTMEENISLTEAQFGVKFDRKSGRIFPWAKTG